MRTSLAIMKISILTIIVILACSTLPAIESNDTRDQIKRFRFESGNPPIQDILFQDRFGYVWTKGQDGEYYLYDGTKILPLDEYLGKDTKIVNIHADSLHTNVFCVTEYANGYQDVIWWGGCSRDSEYHHIRIAMPQYFYISDDAELVLLTDIEKVRVSPREYKVSTFHCDGLPSSNNENGYVSKTYTKFPDSETIWMCSSLSRVDDDYHNITITEYGYVDDDGYNFLAQEKFPTPSADGPKEQESLQRPLETGMFQINDQYWIMSSAGYADSKDVKVVVNNKIFQPKKTPFCFVISHDCKDVSIDDYSEFERQRKMADTVKSTSGFISRWQRVEFSFRENHDYLKAVSIRLRGSMLEQIVSGGDCLHSIDESGALTDSIREIGIHGNNLWFLPFRGWDMWDDEEEIHRKYLWGTYDESRIMTLDKKNKYELLFVDNFDRPWLYKDKKTFVVCDTGINEAGDLYPCMREMGKPKIYESTDDGVYICHDGHVYELGSDKQTEVYSCESMVGVPLMLERHISGLFVMITGDVGVTANTRYQMHLWNSSSSCCKDVSLETIVPKDLRKFLDERYIEVNQDEAVKLSIYHISIAGISTQDDISVAFNVIIFQSNPTMFTMWNPKLKLDGTELVMPRFAPEIDEVIYSDANSLSGKSYLLKIDDEKVWIYRNEEVSCMDSLGNRQDYNYALGLAIGVIGGGKATEDGFLTYSPTGLARYIPDENRFVSFDLSHELDGEEIVDIAVSNSDEVFVATADDIYTLNLPDYTPSFHYASLQSGDSLYYAQDTIVLPYEQSIDVAMRAVQIEYGDRILYNWRLVGQSDDWNGWSKERDVRLERLPRGEYTFEWKMLLPDGGVIRGESVPFTILPPWWLSTWAVVLWGVSGLMVLAISFYLGWLINRRREKQLERVIEKRTRQLREERDRLQNSIEYASLIQQSILPRPEQLLDYVSDASSLWLPRDIVGGDIWWLHKSGKTFYLAMIDCTGHGVPGAFLTIAAHTYLDSIVEQENSPAAILDSLHHAISQLMNQEVWENRQDGMDIALCRIDTESKELIFSGAKLDLYIVRKGELLRYEGERQSIGGLHREKERHFTDRQLRYESGDRFFLLTDGFKDSAVMMDGKRTRLQRKRVEEWMIAWSGFPCADQIDRMHDELTKIKADRDQRDDITILVVDV